MALLEIYCTRPLLSQKAIGYAFDPPPRLVIAGVECEGTWRRDDPLIIEVFSGPLHIAAYQEQNHPVVVWVSRHIPRRPAELAIEVPQDCERIVIEYRASRMWWSPGTIEVRRVVHRA